MATSTGRARFLTTLADNRLVHLAVFGLFVLIFGASALWNLVDPAGGRADYLAHGYPAYVVYPVAAAKLAGLAVILWGRWRTLTGLAFAGFVYDLVLGIGAHIAEAEVARGSLAVFTMLVTVGAWWLDQGRRRQASRPPQRR
jgi:DoxX-like family